MYSPFAPKGYNAGDAAGTPLRRPVRHLDSTRPKLSVYEKGETAMYIIIETEDGLMVLVNPKDDG